MEPATDANLPTCTTPPPLEPPPELAARLAEMPVSKVRWLHRDRLRANDWNPNRVFAPELELLAISILEDTWTLPIVVLDDGDGYFTIVDGFHRQLLSADPRIAERYGGFLPAVVIEADRVHRKMSTVRHNRARGQHGVVPMAAIVRGMVGEGVPAADIERRLGMEREELTRLIDRAGMPERAPRRDGAGDFNREWVPKRDAA